MKEAMKSFGCRLPNPYAKQLEEVAAKYNLSPGLYMRLVVIKALTDEMRVGDLSEMAEFRREVQGIRRDIATATVAILADAGRASADEARLFVQQHLGG